MMDWTHELWSALAVSFGFLAVFGLAELWRAKAGPPVEWTRKAVHVGGGLIVCAFPWLFQSSWTVLLLCLGFGGVLILARILKFLPSVQDVERKSVGELVYPLAVVALFWVAHENKVFYLVPMLSLVVSDALAALIGKSYGRLTYDVDEGESKSFEGSAAFFLSTFLACQLPLLLMTSLDKVLVILVSLQLAYLVTCFEAISLSGLDNLVLPLGGYYILVQISKGNVQWMLGQLGIQGTVLLATLLVAWRFRFLSFSAALAIQLYFYGTFAYGETFWLLAPAAAMLAYLFSKAEPVRVPQRVQVLTIFYAILAPFAILLLNNFLIVFGSGAHAGLLKALPGIFGGLHAGELACLALGRYKGRRLPWQVLLGLGSALILAALSPLGLAWPAQVPGLFVAALLPLLFVPVARLWKGQPEPVFVARRLAVAGAAAAACGLALAWAITA